VMWSENVAKKSLDLVIKTFDHHVSQANEEIQYWESGQGSPRTPRWQLIKNCQSAIERTESKKDYWRQRTDDRAAMPPAGGLVIQEQMIEKGIYVELNSDAVGHGDIGEVAEHFRYFFAIKCNKSLRDHQVKEFVTKRVNGKKDWYFSLLSVLQVLKGRRLNIFKKYTHKKLVLTENGIIEFEST